MTIPLTSDATPISNNSADPLASNNTDGIPFAATTTDIVAVNVEEGGKTKVTSHNNVYSHLPEARNLTWEDTFYESDPNVVAVFDYDKEKCKVFSRRVARWSLGVLVVEGLIFCGLGVSRMLWGFSLLAVIWFALAGYLFYRAYQINKMRGYIDQAQQHVAITTEGIQLDVLGGGDVNNITLKYPYQQISNIWTKKETGYPFCCCAPNAFSVIYIKKHGAVFANRILGVKDNFAFVKLVLAMKKATANPVPAVATATLPPEVEMNVDPQQKQDNNF